MSFGAAVRTCFAKYAVFRGRAGRPEFWWFFLFGVLVTTAASILDATFFGTGTVRFGTGWYGDQGPVATVVNLALLLPNLAVGARRLHDIGRSGWWLLIALVPCVGFIVLLVFFCTGGERQPNRFGPVPA